MAIEKRFAIVAGASTGIGLELARCCVEMASTCLLPRMRLRSIRRLPHCKQTAAAVTAVRTDLWTKEGADRLYEAVQGRGVDGERHAFL